MSIRERILTAVVTILTGIIVAPIGAWLIHQFQSRSALEADLYPSIQVLPTVSRSFLERPELVDLQRLLAYVEKRSKELPASRVPDEFKASIDPDALSAKSLSTRLWDLTSSGEVIFMSLRSVGELPVRDVRVNVPDVAMYARLTGNVDFETGMTGTQIYVEPLKAQSEVLEIGNIAQGETVYLAAWTTGIFKYGEFPFHDKDLRITYADGIANINVHRPIAGFWAYMDRNGMDLLKGVGIALMIFLLLAEGIMDLWKKRRSKAKGEMPHS